MGRPPPPPPPVLLGNNSKSPGSRHHPPQHRSLNGLAGICRGPLQPWGRRTGGRGNPPREHTPETNPVARGKRGQEHLVPPAGAEWISLGIKASALGLAARSAWMSLPGRLSQCNPTRPAPPRPLPPGNFLPRLLLLLPPPPPPPPRVGPGGAAAAPAGWGPRSTGPAGKRGSGGGSWGAGGGEHCEPAAASSKVSAAQGTSPDGNTGTPGSLGGVAVRRLPWPSPQRRLFLPSALPSQSAARLESLGQTRPRGRRWCHIATVLHLSSRPRYLPERGDTRPLAPLQGWLT